MKGCSRTLKAYMSPNLNSLKGVICGSIDGVIKGDTRSLDYGSHWVNGEDTLRLYRISRLIPKVLERNSARMGSPKLSPQTL